MTLGAPDPGGRRKPVPVTGLEFIMDADLIIAAVGEEPDLSFLTRDPAGVLNNGLIRVNPMTLETGIDGLFAGGDAVTGPATVIQALAADRKAAVSIDRYLKGEPLDTGREGEAIHESKLMVDTRVPRAARIAMPALPIGDRYDF